jgi:hypothetical protein
MANSPMRWFRWGTCRFGRGEEAHAEWREWSTPPRATAKLDLGQCVAAMREALPADTIICNGAGNFSAGGIATGATARSLPACPDRRRDGLWRARRRRRRARASGAPVWRSRATAIS